MSTPIEHNRTTASNLTADELFSDFDLADDLADAMEELPELEQWATDQLAAPAKPGPATAATTTTGFAVFDIETSALPWEEIEPFYEAPAALAAFDESTVKYGNVKDTAKRAEKLAEARAKHAAELAGEEADRAAHRQKFVDKAALSPLTGRVLAIGMAYPGNLEVLGEDCNERLLLTRFWTYVESWIGAKTTIVGHNHIGFDLPFLVRRSWRLGVEVPREIFQGRYFHPLFRDTMDVWNCGQRGSGFVKLDDLAKFFGVGAKTGSGADFAKLWAEDRPAAIEYLKNDVKITAAVAKAVGLM